MSESDLDHETDPEQPAETETDAMAEIADEFALLPVGDLHPYANNPKEHPDEQIDQLASAIRQYGWDVPIVVDENNEIIKGHGRLRAAKRLGLDRVPVIVRDDLTDAEKRGARLADNRIAETDWEDELLAQEFAELEDLGPDFDLTLTGFEMDEIDDHLELLQPPEPMGDDFEDDADDVDDILKVVIPVEDEADAETIGMWAEEQGHEWHVVED